VYRRLLAAVAAEDQTERWAAPDRGYGPDKADCERVLETAYGLPSTILRRHRSWDPATRCPGRITSSGGS